MNARLLQALAVMVMGPALAEAQPRISPSDMAGRERERFIDSPVERYMKPGPYMVSPALDAPPAHKRRGKRAKRHRQR